jgi:uncharacterized protein involved in type VI secretion and phage assembly
MSKKFFGKYRGSVLNNVDPQRIGRLQVTVPSLMGSPPALWAVPSFPCAGRQMGVWALPEIGTGVWVEFEEGDLTKPVWTGFWFASSGDVPALALAGDPHHPSIVLQTAQQNCIALSDASGPAGGIVIKTASGAILSINDLGITISNGKGAVIAMNGPVVSINNGALAID